MVDTLLTKNKKILIIGHGSMGKKYEKILKKKFSIFFFDKRKSKNKNFLEKLIQRLLKNFILL